MPKHACAGRRGDVGSRVVRAVVDDDAVEIGPHARELREQRRQAHGLVERGHHHAGPRTHAGFSHAIVR